MTPRLAHPQKAGAKPGVSQLTPARIASSERRFHRSVDRTGGPDACWPWLGGRHAKGYGAGRLDGTKGSHRIAWELAHGEKLGARQALHTCDNPPCCNPAHLFVGTNVENMADCKAKGRTCTGEKNGSAKLTREDVAIIRRRLLDGYRKKAIARAFGVTDVLVHFIAIGKIWKGVEAAAPGGTLDVDAHEHVTARAAERMRGAA